MKQIRHCYRDQQIIWMFWRMQRSKSCTCLHKMPTFQVWGLNLDNIYWESVNCWVIFLLKDSIYLFTRYQETNWESTLYVPCSKVPQWWRATLHVTDGMFCILWSSPWAYILDIFVLFLSLTNTWTGLKILESRYGYIHSYMKYSASTILHINTGLCIRMLNYLLRTFHLLYTPYASVVERVWTDCIVVLFPLKSSTPLFPCLRLSLAARLPLAAHE